MSALAHILERAGIATALIGLIPQHVYRIRPPRALLVPFELGRPFGEPGAPALQARVLRALLALADRIDVPVVEWFEADATASSPPTEAGWACPVAFPAPAPGTDIAAKVAAEVSLLLPWHDRATRARGGSRSAASGMSIEAIIRFLSALLGEDPVPDISREPGFADTFKLAAEDLKLYYLEAATAQPGASSRDLQNWFWRTTSAAELLYALTDKLSNTRDPILKTFAAATLVPVAYRR